MAFKLQAQDQITESVTFEINVGGGKKEKSNIKCTFKKQPVSKIKERQRMFEANGNRPRGEPSDPDCDDLVILADDLLDVTGVVDPEDGAPIPFSDDVRDQLLEIPEVLEAIMLKWTEVNYGKSTAQALTRKNA